MIAILLLPEDLSQIAHRVGAMMTELGYEVTIGEGTPNPTEFSGFATVAAIGTMVQPARNYRIGRQLFELALGVCTLAYLYPRDHASREIQTLFGMIDKGTPSWSVLQVFLRSLQQRRSLTEAVRHRTNGVLLREVLEVTFVRLRRSPGDPDDLDIPFHFKFKTPFDPALQERLEAARLVELDRIVDQLEGGELAKPLP